MHPKNIVVTVAASSAVALLGALACTTSPRDGAVGSVSSPFVPRDVEGVSTCESLGLTTTLEVHGDTINGPHALSDGGSVSVSSDFRFFDWRSTVSFDAVIVVGAASSRIYDAAPDVLGRGLGVPDNADGGAGTIQAIAFCTRSSPPDNGSSDAGTTETPEPAGPDAGSSSGGHGSKMW